MKVGDLDDLMEIAGRSDLDRAGKAEAMVELMKTKSGRECGACSLCCLLLNVPEAGKPEHGWCPHCVKGRGCGIYETRPDICRGYACLWLSDGNIPDHWRPMQAKLVLDFLAPPADAPEGAWAVLRVHVHPKHPHRWREEPYRSDLRRIARNGLMGNPFPFNMVVIVKGEWRWIVLPDHEVEYGPGITLPVGPDRWEFVRCKTDADVPKLDRQLKHLHAAMHAYHLANPRLSPLEVARAVLPTLEPLLDEVSE